MQEAARDIVDSGLRQQRGHAARMAVFSQAMLTFIHEGMEAQQIPERARARHLREGLRSGRASRGCADGRQLPRYRGASGRYCGVRRASVAPGHRRGRHSVCRGGEHGSGDAQEHCWTLSEARAFLLAAKGPARSRGPFTGSRSIAACGKGNSAGSAGRTWTWPVGKCMSSTAREAPTAPDLRAHEDARAADDLPGRGDHRAPVGAPARPGPNQDGEPDRVS